MQLLSRLQKFVLEMRRVLRVTKKPNRQEFVSIVKVSGAGILLIGVIGFLLLMTRELVIFR